MLKNRLKNRSFKSIATAAALAASLVFVGGRAQAQAPFVADDFFIAINGPDGRRLTMAERPRFFNLARCNCQTEVGIYVALLQSGIAKRASFTSPTGAVSVVLGAACNSNAGLIEGQRLGTCAELGAEPLSTLLDQAQFTLATSARTVSIPLGVAGADGGASGTCVAPNGMSFSQTINVNFDFDGDGVLDLSIPYQTIVDLAPPSAPGGVSVQPGGEALVVSWDASAATDLLGYQILCSRADQYQVFAETATADGSGATGPFTAAFVSCPSARTGAGVEGVDPTFVCSPLLGAATTSARIEVLQNEITYAVAVVAIDDSGNATESAVGFGAPEKAQSFYDTYRGGNPPGGAAGGLCAVGPGRPTLAQTLGGLSLFVVGAVGLLGRRRRRRRPPDGSRNGRQQR